MQKSNKQLPITLYFDSTKEGSKRSSDIHDVLERAGYPIIRVEAIEPHASLIAKANEINPLFMVFTAKKIARLFFKFAADHSPNWSSEGNYIALHFYAKKKRVMLYVKSTVFTEDRILVSVTKFFKEFQDTGKISKDFYKVTNK